VKFIPSNILAENIPVVTYLNSIYSAERAKKKKSLEYEHMRTLIMNLLDDFLCPFFPTISYSLSVSWSGVSVASGAVSCGVNGFFWSVLCSQLYAVQWGTCDRLGSDRTGRFLQLSETELPNPT